MRRSGAAGEKVSETACRGKRFLQECRVVFNDPAVKEFLRGINDAATGFVCAFRVTFLEPGVLARERGREKDRKPHPIIRTGCVIDGKLKSIREVVDFRDTFFVVYAFSPINADPENLGEMAKYLAMANYGLFVGNFELDVRDGEIRYKCFVDCDGLDAIPKDFIRRAIHIPFQMFERYGDGIAALAMGFSDAETEIKKAEKDDD